MFKSDFLAGGRGGRRGEKGENSMIWAVVHEKVRPFKHFLFGNFKKAFILIFGRKVHQPKDTWAERDCQT